MVETANIEQNSSPRLGRLFWALAILVFCITFTVYLPALQNGFVNWDDGSYVYKNENISSIDLKMLKWIFTIEADPTWHPLTLFTLAVDYSIWGLDPRGYHLTNIIFHSVNSFLVLILTIRLMQNSAPAQDNIDKKNVIVGISTSILFGIHPMHVESVAWISERKDVLSCFFYLLTLLAYVKYVCCKDSKKSAYYISSLVLFILSLLSKPMAITLPVVFLILDFFPLRRLIASGWKGENKVLIEKLPFFMIALLSAIITVWAQQKGGALVSLDDMPFISRLLLAVRAYPFYLFKLIFPFNLAPFYPKPMGFNSLTFENIASFAILIIISFFCCLWVKKNRLWVSIWFYYLITLLPVVGIFKVGDFAFADRYTYLPSLGPFLLFGLGINCLNINCKKKTQQILIAILLLIAIFFYIGKTLKQISVWRDSVSLWSQEIRIFPGSAQAYFYRGEELDSIGKHYEALDDLNKAIQLKPSFGDAYYIRGTIYYTLGEYKLSIRDFNMAIELKAQQFYKKAFNNRGIAYSSIGKHTEAIRDFNKAIELNPYDNLAYSNRGNAYLFLGGYQSAIRDYNMAIKLNNRYVDAYNNRGYLYYLIGDNMKSVIDLKKAIEIDPKSAEAHYNLGLAYLKVGNRDLAVSCYVKAAALGSQEAIEYLKKEKR